jgi:hypothetical protein
LGVVSESRAQGRRGRATTARARARVTPRSKELGARLERQWGRRHRQREEQLEDGLRGEGESKGKSDSENSWFELLTDEQCFKIRWLFKIRKVANPSNFQKFGKIRKKPEKIDQNEVEPRNEQEKFENLKFSWFDQIIDRFDWIIDQFFKKFDHFWKTVLAH